MAIYMLHLMIAIIMYVAVDTAEAPVTDSLHNQPWSIDGTTLQNCLKTGGSVLHIFVRTLSQ